MHRFSVITSLIIFILASFSVISSADTAAQEAGTIASLKGKVILQRDGAESGAKINDKIYLHDTIETKADSRVKILFSDDSLLSLAENSKMTIKEYLYEKDNKKGASVINLLEGKLKSITGKASFEIHTPTAVAASRGTYFFAWVFKEVDKIVSSFAVVQGIIEIRNSDPKISGMSFVKNGYMGTVRQGAGPGLPNLTPQGIMQDLINSTQVTEKPAFVPEKPIMAEPDQLRKTPPSSPPINKPPLPPSSDWWDNFKPHSSGT
ncbi:MAG: FecR domain-containing protein [Nitrospirota bacterium]